MSGIDNRKKQAANQEFDNKEYTLVLDGDYLKPDLKNMDGQIEDHTRYMSNNEKSAIRTKSPAGASVPQFEYGASAGSGSGAGDASGITPALKEKMDQLYSEYIRIRSMEPGVVDEDDVFPKTYHWRLGGKYDPVKIPILEEALRAHTKIEDTTEYAKYVEEVKNRKYSPLSWD